MVRQRRHEHRPSPSILPAAASGADGASPGTAHPGSTIRPAIARDLDQTRQTGAWKIIPRSTAATGADAASGSRVQDGAPTSNLHAHPAMGHDPSGSGSTPCDPTD